MSCPPKCLYIVTVTSSVTIKHYISHHPSFCSALTQSHPSLSPEYWSPSAVTHYLSFKDTQNHTLNQFRLLLTWSIPTSMFLSSSSFSSSLCVITRQREKGTLIHYSSVTAIPPFAILITQLPALLLICFLILYK